MRSTKAIINLAAIKHNLSIVKQLAPTSKIMAVVKADAYGHGIVEVGKALEEADAIAVACIEEGVALREAGINNEIILLEGFFCTEELSVVAELNFQTVIHHELQVEQLASNQKLFNSKKPLKVWLKIDTGMNRLGFNPSLAENAYSRLTAMKNVEILTLMSHLACADDIKSNMNSTQISKFSEVTARFNGEKSMANSAGVIAWPESHFDWVRPGILLYGCSPMHNLVGTDHKLKPAMTLKSQLFAIHEVQPGDSVGYGATWTAKTKTKVGVIAIGYGDGYPRHAKEGTPVLINGQVFPLIGKVSMDMITVDLGNTVSIQLGDSVTLWGEGLSVETVAESSDTIAYTLLCGVTSRVKYEWHP